MFESVNIESSIPVYVQVENEIMFAVASGKLKAGDPLPAARELAQIVHVNLNTVWKAYRDLGLIQILYMRSGVGVFVERDAEVRCRQHVRNMLVQKMQEIVLEARAAGMSNSQIKELVNVSYASKGVLYGDVPNEVVAIAKKK